MSTAALCRSACVGGTGRGAGRVLGSVGKVEFSHGEPGLALLCGQNSQQETLGSRGSSSDSSQLMGGRGEGHHCLRPGQRDARGDDLHVPTSRWLDI